MNENSIWLRNCWQVAAFASEVGRSILPRKFLNEAVILYRTPEGEPVAMRDRCPHRLVPLSIGHLDGGIVRCGYHGMEFDKTGKCVAVPAQSRIPGGATVRTYPVVDRHNLIWIWMGKPDLADPALIPDLHWFGDSAWTATTGYKHMECDYRLVTDNLLDLSHEAYVHQRTIGNKAAGEDLPKVKVDGDSIIWANREMNDIDPPPFFARIMGEACRIDRWQSAIYMPPGLNVTEAAMRRVGAPLKEAYAWRVLHLITPETRTSAHYFWAMVRNCRLEDDQLTTFIRDAVSATFDEDKKVLELQMKALVEEQPKQFPSVAIMVDAAPVRARRMLAKLIERELQDETAVFQPVPVGYDPIGMERPLVAAR